MPLVWGATLAHYLPLLLTEVGRALPVRPQQQPDFMPAVPIYILTCSWHGKKHSQNRGSTGLMS